MMGLSSWLRALCNRSQAAKIVLPSSVSKSLALPQWGRSHSLGRRLFFVVAALSWIWVAHSPIVTAQTKKPVPRGDVAFAKGSIWRGVLTDKAGKTSEVEVQVTERRGTEFQGKFLSGGKLIREIKGIVSNNRVSWLGIKGGGEPNIGVFEGNRLEITYGPGGKGNGRMVLSLDTGDPTETPVQEDPTRAELLAATDFQKRGISFLKVFGQKSWKDFSPGKVVGSRGYHVAGVVVDRSSQPNRIYIADAGNNRILGFRSDASQTADLVFGQPDEFSGAPNGNAMLGKFGPTARDKLCLLDVPGNMNVSEQFVSFHLDVDGEGNLVVPDFHNNRVLLYRKPFGPKDGSGAGDVLPDFVIGQPDFELNGINRGMGKNRRDAGSLFLGTWTRCVSSTIDPNGNIWVADVGNRRVLRFPKGKATADLVLGQPDFTTAEIDTARSGRRGQPGTEELAFCRLPQLARINPDTGELYVLDDDVRGDEQMRILVFKPPFRNGMAAARTLEVQQPREGDFANGFVLRRSYGFTFNTYKSDEWVDQAKTARYRDGLLWLHCANANPNLGHGGRTVLVDQAGRVLAAVGCPNVATLGGVGGDEQPYRTKNGCGAIGLTSDNHIYLADQSREHVARFELPLKTSSERSSPPPAKDGLLGTGKPEISHYSYANAMSAGRFHTNMNGVLAIGDQLIVRDDRRYLVWNNYLHKPDGCDADIIVGQPSGDAITRRNTIVTGSQMAIDSRNRMWAAGEHGRLHLLQLPLKAGSTILRDNIPLYWADEPEKEVDHDIDEALDFEPKTGRLWVFDRRNKRLLRIKNPDEWQKKLFVDAVLGQVDKTGNRMNRGSRIPDASTIGAPNCIRFDKQGNLFVVDDNDEGIPNGRVIAYAAEDIASINTMFPATKARWVWCVEGFDKAHPDIHRLHSGLVLPHYPLAVTINSKGEMVIANGGAWDEQEWNGAKRQIRQLFLFRKPFAKSTPDAVIELPLGYPADIRFDADDNLIVKDSAYHRLAIINYHRDPAWLNEIK